MSILCISSVFYNFIYISYLKLQIHLSLISQSFKCYTQLKEKFICYRYIVTNNNLVVTGKVNIVFYNNTICPHSHLLIHRQKFYTTNCIISSTLKCLPIKLHFQQSECKGLQSFFNTLFISNVKYACQTKRSLSTHCD